MSFSPLSFGCLQVTRCHTQDIRRHLHDVDVLTIDIQGSKSQVAADMARFDTILKRDPETGQALPKIGLQLSHDGEHAYFHDGIGAQRLNEPDSLNLMRMALNEVNGLDNVIKNRFRQGLDNQAAKLGLTPEKSHYLYKVRFGVAASQPQQNPVRALVSRVRQLAALMRPGPATLAQI